PVEIQVTNAPTQPRPRTNYYTGFAKDTWRVTSRFTVNLGVRFEQDHSFVKAVTKDASPDFPTVFPAATYPRLDVITWKSVVPRFGLAFDLTNKTVVKATFGTFANGLADGFATAYSPLANTTINFRWHDNGDLFYQPGEVNLDPNGPDFVSIAGTSSTNLPTNLKQPMTHEATASFEREVMNN